MKQESNLEKGVSYDKSLDQKKPRGEAKKTKLPTNAAESTSSDRGSFTIK